MAKQVNAATPAQAQVTTRSNGAVLQRSAIREPEVEEVSSIVHDVLRSPGEPLDDETRGFMESRFGEDFSPVRVHTDGRAAASARAVNAHAYTVGRDIVFNEGQYAPQSGEGRKLLAHELTHTIQTAGALPTYRLGNAHSSWEQSADQAALSVTSGQTYHVTSTAPAIIHRKIDPEIKSYLDEIKVIAHSEEVTLENRHPIIARLVKAVRKLDLTDSDNLTLVSQAIADNFPDYIVTGFLLEVGTHTTSKHSSDLERFDQLDRKGREIGRNKFGARGPGIFIPLITATASGLGIDGISLPESLMNISASAIAFVEGVWGGLSVSLSETDLKNLTDKLNKASILTAIFPPIFLAGAVKGIVTDIVDTLKSIVGLFTGEVGEFLADAIELINILVTSEGKNFSFQAGLEIGKAFAQNIKEASNENVVKFAFTMGAIAGPTIIYTVLTLVGAGPAVLGGIAARVLPKLQILLKSEKRLLALANKIGNKYIHSPKSSIPEDVLKREIIKEDEIKKLPPSESTSPKGDSQTSPHQTNTAPKAVQDNTVVSHSPDKQFNEFTPEEMDANQSVVKHSPTSPLSGTREVDPTIDINKKSEMKLAKTEKDRAKVQKMKQNPVSTDTESNEVTGTKSRKGQHYRLFNSAELGPARLNIEIYQDGRVKKVSFELNRETLEKTQVSSRSMKPDETLDAAQPLHKDFTNTGDDRGHLAPREAFAGDAEMERAADLTSNVVPMEPKFNQAGGAWRKAETEANRFAKKYGTVKVEIEPLYGDPIRRNKKGTPIPEKFRRQVIAPDGKTILQDLTLTNG